MGRHSELRMSKKKCPFMECTLVQGTCTTCGRRPEGRSVPRPKKRKNWHHLARVRDQVGKLAKAFKHDW